VRLLVERDDVEADSKDKNGQKLSWAVQNGHEAVVRLLVERDDVEANLRDEYNRTPLLYAVINEHEAVVRLLVERDDVEAEGQLRADAAGVGGTVQA
jgi:ankyrin repeat protein